PKLLTRSMSRRVQCTPRSASPLWNQAEPRPALRVLLAPPESFMARDERVCCESSKPAPGVSTCVGACAGALAARHSSRTGNLEEGGNAMSRLIRMFHNDES